MSLYEILCQVYADGYNAGRKEKDYDPMGSEIVEDAYRAVMEMLKGEKNID